MGGRRRGLTDDRKRCMGMSMLTALIATAAVVESDDDRLSQSIIDQVDLSPIS
jgi:hypothetical protein